MTTHTADQIRKKEKMAETIIEHHFGEKPKEIKHLASGLANFVYEAVLPNDTLIVRICNLPAKINQYLKEQWAVAEAKKIGIPTAEILEVGNEVVPFPYMIIRKIEGVEATNHPERMKIIGQMGKFTALIHTIPTTGFGHVFDWSSNTLSKNDTWRDFLDKELTLSLRLEILEKHEMLSKDQMKKLKAEIKEIENWDAKPALNHGDMRLKNLIVSEDGKINAIIDWEESVSSIAPYWDLSIALHDLSIDEKEAFIEGYGIKEKDFRDKVSAMKVINIINYVPHIEHVILRKDKKGLEKIRNRLQGSFDMFSL